MNDKNLKYNGTNKDLRKGKEDIQFDMSLFVGAFWLVNYKKLKNNYKSTSICTYLRYLDGFISCIIEKQNQTPNRLCVLLSASESDGSSDICLLCLFQILSQCFIIMTSLLLVKYCKHKEDRILIMILATYIPESKFRLDWTIV